MSEHPSGLPLPDLRDVLLNSEAQCLYDPELFTGPSAVVDEGVRERAAREAVARDVCASCPARPACLSYALRVRPSGGVWAGYTADELAALANLSDLQGVEPGARPYAVSELAHRDAGRPNDREVAR